jgi:hypothetical protein
MITCCFVKAIIHLVGWQIRSNGGMMINTGKFEELGGKPTPVLLCPPQISLAVT